MLIRDENLHHKYQPSILNSSRVIHVDIAPVCISKINGIIFGVNFPRFKTKFRSREESEVFLFFFFFVFSHYFRLGNGSQGLEKGDKLL